MRRIIFMVEHHVHWVVHLKPIRGRIAQDPLKMPLSPDIWRRNATLREVERRWLASSISAQLPNTRSEWISLPGMFRLSGGNSGLHGTGWSERHGSDRETHFFGFADTSRGSAP